MPEPEEVVYKTDKMIDIVADVQHAIWSHWMEYLFSISAPGENGSCIISPEKVERWRRQMRTPYSELTEKEKTSDKDQAVKVLDALGIPIDSMAYLWDKDCMVTGENEYDWQNITNFLVKIGLL